MTAKKSAEGHPAPLTHTTRVTVRFKEADALGIVWHGNYVTYLEDARQELGVRIGLSYEDFLDQGYFAPLVDLKIQYKAPARYGDKLDVTATMHYADVPKLVTSYELRRARDGMLLATAETTQVLTTRQGELVLNFPPFFDKVRQAWLRGEIKGGAAQPSPFA
ncbi:MAG: acyl-CoA thioesterase [Planctomycetaceae bacterium]|nr:1,4-dihydroxy-2-naphthoyl-CoA hydrolase [Planctomycetota bacterium]MCQ3950571.1 acyl-CoA thioesterase [Planctomycetota bacterium]NUO16400.1 acyl-CoA thioesterase [Planctomycetaceae bacterium]GIK53717.1 MAG: 4-hydroxybenzoyl-CoA thioesterase [Planctomycetota bacterium]HRJ78235.1 thioesterase family protein [Planctomycetota bacterium]